MVIDTVIPTNLNTFVFKMTVFPFRLTIQLFVALQMCHEIGFLIIILIGWIKMALEFLSLFQNNKKINLPFKTYLNFYSKLSIATKIFSNGQGSIASISFFNALLCTVCANFATFKMYFIIPMPLYLIFPITAVMTLVLVELMLPNYSKCYEHSKLLAGGWKITSMRKSNSFLFKTAKSLSPLKLYANIAGFNLFHVQNSTKSTYLSAVLLYTMNVLVSVSVKHTA